jgi:CubicO group peptidase (beta-lactamase class C family)
MLLSLPLSCGPEPGPKTEPQPEPERAAPPAAQHDRAARVERGLVPLGDDAQPRWDEQAELADRMRSWGVPGLAVAVIDDFELDWAKGYGTTRAGGDDPVSSETLFHAGSVAKVLSTVATLSLVDRGLLTLEGDVNEVLTSWRVPDNPWAEDSPVTLRMLLSHSGGIQDGFSGRSAEDPMPSYFTPEGVVPTTTLEAMLSGAPGVDVDGPTRVVDEPGSNYRYANADFVIVELLARDATGQPFARFMNQTLLDPLGMTSSTFDQPLPGWLVDRASVEHDGSGMPLPGDRMHAPMLAAGGLWTTPTDLARFLVAFMEGYHGRSDALLSRSLAREMMTRQIGIEGSPLADAAGLGFQLGGEGTDVYGMHTGGTWGSTALIWIHPETGKGAVIMTNSATGSFIRFEILLAIAVEYGWPL